MLTESPQVRQEPGRSRRWFGDDQLELIVWLDEQEGVEGFQLCHGAQALTWRRAAGFTAGRIDEGDATPLKNLTPVVEPGGAVAWAELTELFRARSVPIEAKFRELILSRLEARI